MSRDHEYAACPGALFCDDFESFEAGKLPSGAWAGCAAQDAGYVWVAPAFSNIYVGWKSYQVDDERSIWIDDVVIGSSKVGCPSPAL